MRFFTQAEFIRMFSVFPNSTFDFFLGSGASVQAGIPTGYSMTWAFKRDIYCTETGVNPGAMKDLQSEYTQSALQAYFDAQQETPTKGDPLEYAYYFQRCHPTSAAREIYIQNKVRGVKPSVGHLCLASLIMRGRVTRVWTTNFDELVESGIKTLEPSFAFKIHSSANQKEAAFTADSTFPAVIKLHGDYRYDHILNTPEELQALESTMGQRFSEGLNNKGLVVIGYSGSDESIMSQLEMAVENKSLRYGLIWMTRSTQLPPRVEQLMEHACQISEMSCVVQIDGFDDILFQLYSALENKERIIEELGNPTNQKLTPLYFSGCQADSFVKTNAFISIAYPMYRSFETDITSWKQLRAITDSAQVPAALFSGKIYCFESDECIRAVFGDHVKSAIKTEHVSSVIQNRYDSIYTGLLYSLIEKSLTSTSAIKKLSKNTYYDVTSKEVFRSSYYVYDAIEIQLELINGKYYLNILPTVYLTGRTGKALPLEEKKTIINAYMSSLYNQKYNEKLSSWNKKLISKDRKIVFQYNNFEIVFDGISVSSSGKQRNGKWPELKSHQYEEPPLQFSMDDRTKCTVNQLYGLTQFGPLDYSYAKPDTMPRTPIRLAVICPNEHVDSLIGHLNHLKTACAVVNNKEAFVRQYNGFENVFRRSLDVPMKEDTIRCLVYPEQQILRISRDSFVAMIKRGIDKLAADLLSTDLVVVYIPKSFNMFREDVPGAGDFNLHDAVKLYAMDKGVKVQFIEERSIRASDQCKVMWGLSTSIYAKANGILWQPSEVQDNTAFIGVSYATSSSGINIGCSQLFDSTGAGMRMLMRKIVNPGFMGRKNPYMKADEARAMLGALRAQYYASTASTPLTRIVIHKTTPFTKEEIRGFTQAFEGIEDIELLQIQEMTPWRAVRFYTDFNKGAYPYPIKRGTVCELDSNSFLLWTNGSVMHDDINPRGNYYKGGRGIPTPLYVKRFYGKGSGDTIVKEVLMLTKMNWNSGDSMYKTLPVTLDFAKVLSRMSKQTEALYDRAYDFRFFM